MENYNIERTKWLSLAVDVEKDVPYAKRSKASLLRELEHR